MLAKKIVSLILIYGIALVLPIYGSKASLEQSSNKSDIGAKSVTFKFSNDLGSSVIEYDQDAIRATDSANNKLRMKARIVSETEDTIIITSKATLVVPVYDHKQFYKWTVERRKDTGALVQFLEGKYEADRFYTDILLLEGTELERGINQSAAFSNGNGLDSTREITPGERIACTLSTAAMLLLAGPLAAILYSGYCLTMVDLADDGGPGM
jgi:hypothetical protein